MERYEEYKDSGVAWIGEIPEGWNIKKLKYVLSDRLKYGANESALFENPGFRKHQFMESITIPLNRPVFA